MLRYINFKKDEIIDIITAVLVLSFMFSLTIYIDNYKELIIPTVFFISFLLFTKIFIMKLYAYANAFEINFKLTSFNKYGIKTYDKLSYYTDKRIKSVMKFKGFPTYIISIMLYILTATMIIFPGFWKYTVKKIEHKHFGFLAKFEIFRNTHERVPFTEITLYRQSLASFTGHVYMMVVLVFLKFANFENGVYFIYIILVISFGNLIPIPGTEGFSLFFNNRFLWYATITLFSCAIILFIVSNIWLYISLLSLSVFIVLLAYLWQDIVGS